MQALRRRQFLKQSALLSLTPFPAAFSSLSASESQTDGRILVVIQLSGGNDGINTVVPFTDEGYKKNRKKLRLDADKLIKVNEHIGLHPSLRGAADLLEDGRLVVVQGVGYPDPNRSHDVSMAIWQSARMDRLEHKTYGWLGRAMDNALDNSDGNLAGSPDMVLLGSEAPPLAIRSRRSTAVAMAHLDDLKLNQPISLPLARGSSADTLVDFAHATTADAVRMSQLIETVSRSQSTAAAVYPATGLSGRLQSIASLIKSGFATPVYYAIQSGYDTHSVQLPVHARLLRELGGGLKAFHDDLESAGLGERVITFCFSEFGRRVQENGSLGTDHGAAGPVFVAGKGVNAGLIGNPPSLVDLEEGDLKMQIDFRKVYATLLRDWLRIDPRSALDSSYGSLPIFS